MTDAGLSMEQYTAYRLVQLARDPERDNGLSRRQAWPPVPADGNGEAWYPGW